MPIVCPVFKTTCKGKACISYYVGYVWGKSGGKYILEYPRCASPLVTGIIEHKQDE